MIIRIFQKSYLQHYIFLGLIAILLWGSAFISPRVLADPGNPFLNPGWSLLTSWLGQSPYVMVALAFLLMLASALLLNFTLEKYGLSGTNSLIPALILILVMSLFPSLMTLHQGMVPGFLIIVVINFVFHIYSEEEAYPNVFNSGFFIALSSMFYFPSVVFLFFVWTTFIVYRLFKWREWMILLFGFFTPYVLLWTYYFWTDDLSMAFGAYLEYFTPKLLLRFSPGLTIMNYFSMGIVILLFFRALFIQAVSIQGEVISLRKYFSATVLFFTFSLASFLFSGALALFHVIFLQIALALVIQGLAPRLRRYFVTELMVWIVLALVLINNYYVALQSF